MPQSLANVLVHIVFSTKDRYPFLGDKDFRSELHAYLGGTSKACGCAVLCIGGVADHVHLLCSLSRTMALANLIQELKVQSSKWAKTKKTTLRKFSWQNGYGVFSVGRGEINHIVDYIRNQEEHHRRTTFQDEYRALLREYEMEFDERYVWD
ncbi:MAG: IS200/IS605 family transposase [Bacteroidetes bacterium]|nr:IS200/IS605 family transposase [Bacteroidota bacterium]MCW5894080.1 IS200/IS605 family transposase [Bacteroidota bacterium]